MKIFWASALVAAVVASGCTSVRMVQRDGCWVRRTETFPKQVNEELGPCARPEPKWSNDRLARMVQECMAQSDYRWQNRALQAWAHGQPLPPQDSEERMLHVCMDQAANTLQTENAGLKSRLADLSKDRDSLKESVAKDEAFLRESHDRLTSALGEAAKKPAPSAVATATSSGKASTKSDLAAQPGVSTLTTVPVPMSVPMSNPTAAMCPLPKRSASKSSEKVANKEKPAPPSCTPVPKDPSAKLADVAAPEVKKVATPEKIDGTISNGATPGRSAEP